MSEPVLQLTTQENWFQIYDESRTAQIATPSGGYYPIPAFEIPILLERHVLAVRCLSTTAKAMPAAGYAYAFVKPPSLG
jgi:hypothetical protein